MRKDNYFSSIPEGYSVVRVIDAKDKKTMVWMNVVSLLLTIGSILCFLPLALKQIQSFEEFRLEFRLWVYFLFLVGMFVYIVLHELVHGLFYKIYTGEKLTFGFTGTVAYCGVPNLYVKRIPMIVTTLAPFVTFVLAFGIPLFFFQQMDIRLLFVLLMGVHIGGCTGDLYDAILLTFKYTEKDLIINDTGPKQTIYHKEY